MPLLGLTEKDTEKFLQILTDAKECLNCEIGIGGSIAQRALSPKLTADLRNQALHDVDLLLIGTTEDSPELSSLRNKFRVIEIVDSAGWYYGMIHKNTGMPVDLFTPTTGQKTRSVIINGERCEASTLESQILYLARDILRRTKNRFPVRKKWIDKLKTLVQLPAIDWQALEKEYTDNLDHFSQILPSPYYLPMKVDDFIQLAIHQKATSRLKEKLFLIRWFLFSRKTKTADIR